MEPCNGYIPLMSLIFSQIPMTREALMDCGKVSEGYSRPSMVLIPPFVSGIVSSDSLPATLPLFLVQETLKKLQAQGHKSRLEVIWRVSYCWHPIQ